MNGSSLAAPDGGHSGVGTGTEGSAGQANLQGRVPADVPVPTVPAVAGTGSHSGYGGNVTAFERDHPAWRLSAGPGGFGYTARRRVKGGGPVSARTLDELAALLGDPSCQHPEERRPKAIRTT
jgi:hypothetical protein